MEPLLTSAVQHGELKSGVSAVPGDPTIQHLIPYSRLFVLQSNAGFGRTTSFKIVDESGQLVFNCSLERFAVGRRSNLGKTVYTVNDTSGSNVLSACSKANKNQMLITSGANYPIGSVEGGFKSSNYTATSADGLATFELQSHKSSTFGETDQYPICCGTHQIGVMKRGLPNAPSIHANNFGMEFPYDLDVRAKALLLGCGVQIYDLHYMSTLLGRSGGGRHGSNLKISVAGIACIILGFIVIGVAVIVIFLNQGQD